MSEQHCTMRAVNINLGPAIVTMSKNSYEPQGLLHMVRIKPSSSTVWSRLAKGYRAQHNVQLTLSGCFPTSPVLLARGSLLLCILTSFSRKKISSRLLQRQNAKQKRLITSLPSALHHPWHALRSTAFYITPGSSNTESPEDDLTTASSPARQSFL